MGYAACPVMGLFEKMVQELKIPDDRVIALLIAIGYPTSASPKPRLPRKKVDDVIHWETF